MVRVLRELGAKPLVLSMPIHGSYHDYMGVSVGARGAYYQRLGALMNRYRVPGLDFADHDGDNYFSRDYSAHPSDKGWVYYDRALDAFYHDRLR